MSVLNVSKSDRNNLGFTLIELLVVISIIALLMAILMPSLTKAREIARKTVCLSNFRTLGIAMSLYNEDNKGYFPPCYTFPRGSSNEERYSNVWWSQKLLKYIESNAKAILCSNNRKPDEKFNFYYEYAAATSAPDFGEPSDAKIGYNHTFLSCTRFHAWCKSVDDGKFAKMRKVTNIKQPATTIALAGTKSWVATYSPTNPKLFNTVYNSYSHGGGINVGFVDTHAESINSSKMGMLEDSSYWTGGAQIFD